MDPEIELGERKRVKNVFEELNLGLLVHVIYGSLLYVLIFIIISGTIAFAYLRWTPDVYETKAVLMAKSSKQTQLLGFDQLLKDDANEVKLEIQLMKSRFLMSRALDSLNLNVSYFSKGRFLETENFRSNPYSVDLVLKDQDLEGKNFYVNFLDNNTYQISDFVTSYHPAGETPPQFRYTRNLNIDWNIQYGYRLLEEINVVGHSIAASDQPVNVDNVIKPKQWKQIIFGYSDNLATRNLIVDPKFMQDSTIVQSDGTNPDRLDTTFNYKRSPYVRISSTTGTGGFSGPLT